MQVTPSRFVQTRRDIAFHAHAHHVGEDNGTSSNGGGMMEQCEEDSYEQNGAIGRCERMVQDHMRYGYEEEGDELIECAVARSSVVLTKGKAGGNGENAASRAMGKGEHTKQALLTTWQTAEANRDESPVPEPQPESRSARLGSVDLAVCARSPAVNESRDSGKALASLAPVPSPTKTDSANTGARTVEALTNATPVPSPPKTPPASARSGVDDTLASFAPDRPSSKTHVTSASSSGPNEALASLASATSPDTLEASERSILEAQASMALVASPQKTHAASASGRTDEAWASVSPGPAPPIKRAENVSGRTNDALPSAQKTAFVPMADSLLTSLSPAQSASASATVRVTYDNDLVMTSVAPLPSSSQAATKSMLPHAPTRHSDPLASLASGPGTQKRPPVPMAGYSLASLSPIKPRSASVNIMPEHTLASLAPLPAPPKIAAVPMATDADPLSSLASLAPALPAPASSPCVLPEDSLTNLAQAKPARQRPSFFSDAALTSLAPARSSHAETSTAYIIADTSCSARHASSPILAPHAISNSSQDNGAATAPMAAPRHTPSPDAAGSVLVDVAPWPSPRTHADTPGARHAPVAPSASPPAAHADTPLRPCMDGARGATPPALSPPCVDFENWIADAQNRLAALSGDTAPSVLRTQEGRPARHSRESATHADCAVNRVVATREEDLDFGDESSSDAYSDNFEPPSLSTTLAQSERGLRASLARSVGER
eukprot:GEMP01005358.1.p1 GENE.GEMP01005358.1~~GEMP01005358.1.p1  ORF type:complete len:725 (+),score=209.95 GEMP01005358.1:1177-3351(+)